MKYSQGFTKLVPSILTIVGMIASFYFLALAMKNLPLGTAYAIWTGIGTVGTVILGMVFFNDSVNLMKIVFLGFIVVGIIGLKFASPH